MARTDSLVLLAEIIDRLEPVGEAERGTPLRSADWNTVVDAVSSLARLVVSREETLQSQLEEGYAPASHDHRGEATLAWFEPDTRRLLESATGGAVDQRLSLKRIDRDLGAIRSDIKTLRAEFEELRQGVDQLRDADFARERKQGRLQNDIESLRRLEGSFENLSDRFVGLDDGITSVLELQDQLVDDDGERIDLSGFNSRISELEEVRDNLITADGRVVRIREIESSIARLEQDVLGRDEIDGLIVDRVNEAGVLENPAFLDRVSERVSIEIDPRLTAVEGGVTELRASQDLLASSMTPLEQRLDGADLQLARVGTRLDGIESLSPRLNGVEGRVAANEAGLASLETRTGQIDRLGGDLRDLTARVDGLDRTAAQAATNAAAISALTSRTDDLEDAASGFAVLSDRVSTLETRTAPIDGLNTRVSSLETQADTAARRLDMTEAELGNLEGTATRLSGLEQRTSGLEEWRVGANRSLEQLRDGSNRAVDQRLSVLEERVADQGAEITRLRTTDINPGIRGRSEDDSLIRTRDGTATGVVRRP